MFEKFYIACVSFFAFLTIFGLYSSYFGLINFNMSLLILILSLILSLNIIKKIKTEKVENSKGFYLTFLLFLLLLTSATLPSFVIPHGAGDFQNQAKSVRITAKKHTLKPFPIYPNSYYAIGSIFYSIYPHTYRINSILPILLEALSLVGVFLIGKSLYDEKIGLLASIIYGFSITNIFYLEQGFFPAILGQFFFISSVYLFLKEENLLLLLSTIGLLSYPHYFIVYLVFLILESVNSKKWSNSKIPIISLLIMSPEVIGIFGKRLVDTQRYNLVLIDGGILTPPLFSFLIFSFSILGYYFVIKKRQIDFINLNLSILSYPSLIFFVFLYNMLLKKGELHQLYMAVKFFYLFVFPLSIATAIGAEYLMRRYKIIIILFFIFHIIYFVGYLGVVLPKKANFSGEAYEIFEKMDTLEGEFKVGIDLDLINNKGWEPRFPYKSIVDVPDLGYLTGEIAKVELGRALQFHWADYIIKEDGIGVLNSKGEDVVKFDTMDVDYYITDDRMEKPIVFQDGNIRVYKVINYK